MTAEDARRAPQGRLFHALLFTQVYQLRAMQEQTVLRCTGYLWETLPWYVISIIVILILNRPPRHTIQMLKLDELHTPEVLANA
jgi:ABC-type uncharacterized transport system permease subunit